jgi:hypothetical protein
MMDETFRQYAEALHPAFQQLMNMSPVAISRLPKKLPAKCIYLFSEGDNHLYVGRTRKFRSRLRQHSIPAAQHNQAVFAFKLAREATGFTEASYTPSGSRRALLGDARFAEAFGQAKTRIRSMELRFVEEADPVRQALLEIYVAVVLETKYNDFKTH